MLFRSTITSECEVKTDEINAKVKEGVNTIILKPGCHYETSQLIVHTVHKVEQLQDLIEFDEIDTVNTLASLDELLEEGYPPGNICQLSENNYKNTTIL